MAKLRDPYEDKNDIIQETYDYENGVWRTYSSIVDPTSGFTAQVLPDGSIKTTSTAIISGDIFLKVDPRDGMCKYGEVSSVSPSASSTITSISIASGQKLNLMAATMQGTGIGDYRILAGAYTQARKVDLNPVDFNFGFNGITINGPNIIYLNVTNVDFFYNGPRYNKPNDYFGSLIYTVEPIT